MKKITLELLQRVFPSCNKNLVLQLLPFFEVYLPKFGIDTDLELCHFLAQAGHETDSFRSLTEYASGTAYEGRIDLGNTKKGDGVRYKGHGIFMTTGKTNHVLTGKKIFKNELFGEGRFAFANDAVIERPETLAWPQWAVASACIYWIEKDLSTLCKPDNEKVTIRRLINGNYVNYSCSPIEAITRKINGGVNGLSERRLFYERLKTEFSI